MSCPRSGKNLGLQLGPDPERSTKERRGDTWKGSQAQAQGWHRGAREELGKVAGARRVERAQGAEGRAAGDREWPGVRGVSSPARPLPGPSPAQPAALTRGPGGVARRCGSSRPAAAATATAEAGTHHAAALMAGPERAPRLGSGGCRRAGRREAAAEHTRGRGAQPGEPGGATPGSEPHEVSGTALAQFRPRRCRLRRGCLRRLVGTWKPGSSRSRES